MLTKKVFQLFIIGTGENFDTALNKGLGGVIFFKDDIKSVNQFCELIYNIKKNSILPPFLSIDQEGGKVERTENIHPKRYLSQRYAYNKGEDYLSTQTDEMLKELKNYGINMNFAPCLDVNTNPDNPIIGERAFSDKPEDVCKGYNIVKPFYDKYKILPVIKHFPGHGDASADSHKELPFISLSLTEMEKIHIQPFKHAINNGADAVMVAHLHCKCFNKEKIPTVLSKNCLDYLRNNLNFKGVIISDDMYMNGVADYDMTEACIKGIKAGLNMFIYRNASDSTINVIENVIKYAQKDEILKECIEYSYNKIINLKQKYGIIR